MKGLTARLTTMACAALLLTGAAGASAATKPPVDAQCTASSPSSAPCVLLDKLAEGAAWACRSTGAPDANCVLPAGNAVRQEDMASYVHSWTKRAVDFQYRLGGSLPLTQAQWLGTHNSFNSLAYGPTISHSDSNQQLTLSGQLDLGIRELELDTHWLPAANGKLGQVVICHGRPPSEQNFGCTTEAPLTSVLSELDTWLNAHPDQVVLVYLDDNFGPAQAYSDAASELEAGVRGPDGHSLVLHPTASASCTKLPLTLSRDSVRRAGAQVVLVATTCAAGWSGDVFSWAGEEVESGSTPAFRPFPACDASYGASVYGSHIVRYYEDSTFVSAATNPTQTPAQDEASALTAQNVGWMTNCGVNLFGFDQILPGDGRLAATVWSWAPGEPVRRDGRCTEQREDGRWGTARCAEQLPAACANPLGGWFLTSPVSWRRAAGACSAEGGTTALPRTGLQNSQLRAVAGAAGPVWLGLGL